MKKIIVSSVLVILTLILFQTNNAKCDTINGIGTSCNKSMKPFLSVQCANITCHNAGTSHQEMSFYTNKNIMK